MVCNLSLREVSVFDGLSLLTSLTGMKKAAQD